MKIKYRYDIEAAKSICHNLRINKKSKIIPHKKMFNKKKERKKNKIKIY